jgi:diacylglycerol kinase (ATP)
MKVFVDGELAESDATFVVIGNMRRYGGPFQLFERATPDDGKLDVCCLRGRHALDLLRYSWNAFWKTLAKQPDVFYHLADRVRVESDQKVLVQVDGDQGGELPMDFQVLPGAVNFCVSDHNPHGESAAEKAVANTSC